MAKDMYEILLCFIIFDKPQGFPGNLSGLSGFEWGFSRDPWCLCRVSVCISVVFSGVCAGNPWA